MNVNTIKQAIADSKTKVVSFDVFDTLLVRPFWFPTDLFFFLDKEMEDHYKSTGIINFSNIRKEAEVEAREKAISSGREDVTYKEIYDHIAGMGLFDQDAIQLMMQKELDLERRFCTGRNSIKELVRYAAKEGKTVIATSDMYLPSEFISELLIQNGFSDFKHIFVSCETGVCKGTGHLYEYVAEQLKVRKDEIVHIGDNLKTDVKVPRKLGIRAYPFYRTLDMLAGENGIPLGNAFKKAYKQVRTPLSNYKALEKLGTRCMLAVAANLIYDDPFRKNSGKGDYADDPQLFGNLAIGMYSMAHALWVDRLIKEDQFDRVLFFSRDGFLPYKGFQLLQKYTKEKAAPVYVRSSRKAIMPLLMTSKERLLTAGSHMYYENHSPKSMTNVMMPVLKDDLEQLKRSVGEKWQTGFTSELSMMRFLKLLFDKYVDKEKLRLFEDGYKRYFTPIMDGKILTYDVGYSLRNETILRSYFPNADITACFTHSIDDACEKRGDQGNIKIRTFYPSAPYVSWLPREMFLTEEAPSCIGYTADGEPIMGETEGSQELIDEIHGYALRYMETFTGIFREDSRRLPLEYSDACLPFETFLTSPSSAEKHWVKGLEAENSIDSGVTDFKCYNFWRELRTDYWIAKHHLGKTGRHAVRFVMLTYTNRDELKLLIKKRLPKRFK